jgi:hypothetical protein
MVRLKKNSSTSKSDPPKSAKTTSLKSSKPTFKKNLSITSKDKSRFLDQSNSPEELIRDYCDISSDDSENEEEVLISDDETLKHGLNKENIIEEQSENTATDEEIAAEINVKEIEEEETLSEISFKLIIKQEKESSAAKWEVINQTTFRKFRRELNLLIQNQLDAWVAYDDYVISYKLGREAGSGTQLSDERDWKRFLTEYQKSSVKKKETMILATFKSQKNDSRKRLDYYMVIYKLNSSIY